MKIAIPTNDKINVANHFGRCLLFLVFDENLKVINEVINTSEHMGGNGLPPELLRKNGVDVLLCKDLGPNAIKVCQEQGVRVYKFYDIEKVSDLAKLWKSGKLSEATLEDGCESHK